MEWIYKFCPIPHHLKVVFNPSGFFRNTWNSNRIKVLISNRSKVVIDSKVNSKEMTHIILLVMYLFETLIACTSFRSNKYPTSFQMFPTYFICCILWTNQATGYILNKSEKLKHLHTRSAHSVRTQEHTSAYHTDLQ